MPFAVQKKKNKTKKGIVQALLETCFQTLICESKPSNSLLVRTESRQRSPENSLCSSHWLIINNLLLLLQNITKGQQSYLSAQNYSTSNSGSPVSLDKAPNSIIIVPAQAVHVSDSVPAFDEGWWMPYFKFTCWWPKERIQTQWASNENDSIPERNSSLNDTYKGGDISQIFTSFRGFTISMTETIWKILKKYLVLLAVK